MKRIIFIMVFGIVLLLGGVIALSLTSDSLRIEKVGDVYSIYELKEKISVNNLLDRKSQFESILNELSTYKFSYKECYDGCIGDLFTNCEIEAVYGISYKDCELHYIERCSDFCDVEITFFPEMVEMEKESLNQEIDKINSMLKLK